MDLKIFEEDKELSISCLTRTRMTTMYLDFGALLEPWLEQWPVSILTLLVIVLGVYLYRKLPKSIVPLNLSIIAICQVIQVVHLIYSL